MRAALYVRTSTADQDGRAQLHALKKAAAARGLKNPRVFVDVGHSGATSRRPALEQLQRAAVAGELEHVVVTALDRLARSLPDLLQLVEQLAGAGVALVSLREQLDFSTPSGRLMLQLAGAFAQFERELTRERINAGLQRAKEKGTRSGRPIGRPSRAVDVDQVKKLRRAGASWRTIAQKLHTPRGTLQRKLELAQNPPPKRGLASPRAK